MHPAQQIAMQQEAESIKKCKNDPDWPKDLCPVCVIAYPCACDRAQTIEEMRKYYEANRRTLFRREPKLIGSWGKDMDGLMSELYNIATRKWKKRRL